MNIFLWISKLESTEALIGLGKYLGFLKSHFLTLTKLSSLCLCFISPTFNSWYLNTLTHWVWITCISSMVITNILLNHNVKEHAQRMIIPENCLESSLFNVHNHINCCRPRELYCSSPPSCKRSLVSLNVAVSFNKHLRTNLLKV